MTSSTKLEVHNVLHCHQRRIDPRPQVTCAENFMNVVSQTWANRQSPHILTCSSEHCTARVSQGEEIFT